MSAKSLAENVFGFIKHYAGELGGIVTAISTIVNTLPIDSHDKANVNEILDSLRDSIVSINDALANLGDPQEVVIKKSDLIAAVKEFLETDEGKALLGNGGTNA